MPAEASPASSPSRKAVEPVTADPAEPLTAQAGFPGPATDTETAFAEVLAGVVRAERVPVDSHFFDDLGADSMLMAQFCARVRKRDGLPSVSMKDIYRHPTIRSLSTALADDAPTQVESSVPVSSEAATPAGTLQYVLCGALQLMFFVGYAYVAALVFTRGYAWTFAGSGLVDVYLRSVLFGGASFLGLCILPILAKWILVGRWKPQQIRVWSLAYVRFWIVKTLVQRNPVVLFAGSPLYVLYLRALGANIGRGVAIFSRHVPVCTDLLTVGDGAVIRKDTFFTCYRAEGGVIQTGAVTLGRNAVVGEVTVLDIETSLGDGAQLGHSSSLHAGQAVPDGKRRHGFSAQERTEVDYQGVVPASCGTLRRAVYAVTQLLGLVAVRLPLAIGGLALLIAAVPQLDALRGAGSTGVTS
jgi:acetyltransferase-like isoleucine patch superfamily enzyme